MPVIDYFIRPSHRFFFAYLISAGIIAVVYLGLKRQPINLQRMRAYWLHRSAIIDYGYFLVSGMVKIYLVLPLLWLMQQTTLLSSQLLDAGLGEYRIFVEMSRNYVVIAYVIFLFIIDDLTRYGLHRLLHCLPFLWVFHKVHHSAEVLNPATFYRVHPVENMLFGLRYALIVGIVTGVFVHFFGARILFWDIVGVNTLLFVFHGINGNLRHSHIELAYPTFLEKWFISPRQHQLHHSSSNSHCNYGSYLALWDRCWGTLTCSRDRHQVDYGLGAKDCQRYNNIIALFVNPFIDLTVMLYRRKPLIKMIILFTLLGLFVSGVYAAQVHKLPVDPNDPTLDKISKMKIALGSRLFFDKNLSKNRTMSCSSCHSPAAGFSDHRKNPLEDMVSEGDNGYSFGGLNAPTAGYAMFSPPFHQNTGKDKRKSNAIGGQFWDGRSPTLADQAEQPVLNPVEMGMPDKASVIARIKQEAGYVATFKTLFGEHIFDDTEAAYKAMALAIQAFEQTTAFAPFDSKYDRFLQGNYDLTVLEDLGRSLFFSNNNVNCSTCHKLRREDAPFETFSNYQYRNIGVPMNYALVAKGIATKPAPGLFANPHTWAKIEANKGKFKVPTLRNVAVTGPYMHNGVFKDLRTVILFYDHYNNPPKRKLNPETGKPWSAPAVTKTVDRDDLRAKALTDRQVDALIAFLKTLTDKRYEPLLEKGKASFSPARQ